jgi:peptidoglycan/xylan/chitin deacetylase (PgdA/CDA1 family)
MLRILTYHRIAPSPDGVLNPRLISATPEDFAYQMEYVSAHFDLVSASDVVEWASSGRRLPRRALLITFDDAYRDFALHAWPLLRRYRIRPVLFVPTAFPDTTRQFWWDRLFEAFASTSLPLLHDPLLGEIWLTGAQAKLRCLRQVQNRIKTLPHTEAMALVDRICHALLPPSSDRPAPVLGWEQLRCLSKAGVTLGAHTRTHPVLTQVGWEQLCEEVFGSQRDLQRQIGYSLPIFSYPSGLWNDKVRACLRHAGFVVAFTATPGINQDFHIDPLLLGRTNITLRTSRTIFRARLSLLGTWLDLQRDRRRSYA